MYLAADTSTRMIGSIGLGGLALILTATLILGTRKKTAHELSKGQAIVTGLFAGMAFMGAGQVWDVPDDLVLTALEAAGVGRADGPLGMVGMGAISILCIIIAGMVKLKPRAAGVLGIVMASVFTNAGGMWAMGTKAIADFAMGLIQ